jgi:hypothetical protein
VRKVAEIAEVVAVMVPVVIEVIAGLVVLWLAVRMRQGCRSPAR